MENPVITDIDRRTCTRVVPMKVICAGMPRTGTFCMLALLPIARSLIHPGYSVVLIYQPALRTALKMLGFEDTYHMYSCAVENQRDCEMWIDATRAKFEGVGSFEKKDWDALLGHCQV